MSAPERSNSGARARKVVAVVFIGTLAALLLFGGRSDGDSDAPSSTYPSGSSNWSPSDNWSPTPPDGPYTQSGPYYNGQ